MNPDANPARSASGADPITPRGAAPVKTDYPHVHRFAMGAVGERCTNFALRLDIQGTHRWPMPASVIRRA